MNTDGFDHLTAKRDFGFEESDFLSLPLVAIIFAGNFDNLVPVGAVQNQRLEFAAKIKDRLSGLVLTDLFPFD